MGVTDFASQQPERKRAWGHAAYQQFRDKFFFDKMLGNGDGCIVEHVTELTKTDKGTTSAMLHLIADLYGGGSVGDNEIEGRESTLQAYWQEITIDQIRKAVRNKGRMADQRSVIQFRKPAKDKLGRWMAEMCEEQLVLCASGISFAYNTDGSTRVTPTGEDAWTDLDYAADVVAPSTNRHVRWSGSSTGSLAAGDTTAVTATDLPVYAMIPEVISEAQSRKIKPIVKGGKEYYVFLVHPKTLARFFRDSDFRSAIVNADVRGEDNKIFSGAIVTMHGAIIHPYNKVFTTRGATSGSGKWGAGSNVEGSRTLLLGSQALAFADLNVPEWDEEEFDYGNQQGIAIRKQLGMLKPQFYAPAHGTTEDFGIMAVDHAI